MGICYLTRREKKEVEEQLGIYGVGTDARPNGTVVIPNKVTVLATRVFQNDKNVTKIYLPPYLQDIQARAFENCTALQTIIFPQSLQTIYEYAFNGCNKLTDIAIPDNIPLLKPYAFGGNNIDKLILNSTFSPKLWDYAYADNHSIGSVTIDCYSVSQGCFAGSDIKTVIIKDNVRILRNRAFENCKQLTTFNMGEEQSEENVFQVNLLEIGDYCFHNSGVQSIVIPKSIKKIGEYCFAQDQDSGVHGLKNVLLEEGLTSIGTRAFSKSALEEIFIPKSMQAINIYAFDNCAALSIINFEDGLKEIGTVDGYCFSNCGVLSLNFPASIQKISKYAFYNCDKLEEVTFNNDIDKDALGKSIFESCNALYKVNLPENMQSLGEAMFRGCTSLKTIALPNGFKHLGERCFENSGLETLDIPETIESIGSYCFNNCKLSAVSLPKTLEIIEPYTFSGCDQLGRIDFDYIEETLESGQGIHTIKDYAFSNSIITTLSIPYTIQEIGPRAFQGSKISTLKIDKIKNTIPGAPWGASSATIIWRESTLTFHSNLDSYFELWISQNDEKIKTKVNTVDNSTYVFEPLDNGITLNCTAYAPNKAPVVKQLKYTRLQREVEEYFNFSESNSDCKIEFVVTDEKGDRITDAQITADTLFDDFKYTYHSYIFYVNKNTDIIQYKVLRSGYGIVYGKLYNIEKNETIEIQLSKNGYSYIELSYPFNEHQEYLSNILDGKHYRKSLMIDVDAYANTLQSINTKVGTKESSMNAAYVKFRTPADLYSENTITIKFIIANTGYSGQNFKAVLGPSPYYKDCEESWTYPSPSQSGGQNFIGLGEERLNNYMNSTEVRTIQKQVNNLKPNTDYYISFAHNFRNIDWSYDPERAYQKIFIKSISFYSCPIAISTEYPEYISSKNDICLYDGIGKTEAYINTEFFDTIESKLIFEKVSTLTGNSLYFWYRSNSNCCGNILDKSYSISHSTGGYTDASIFKLKQSIDLTNYAKIKITCLLFHDYSNTMTVGSYCRLTNNAEDIIIPTAASSLDTAISYDWGDWNQIYAGQIPTGVERFATITLDVSKLEGIYELYFGTYHGVETSDYTAYNGVVEVELYTKEEEIINEIETESTIIE